MKCCKKKKFQIQEHDLTCEKWRKYGVVGVRGFYCIENPQRLYIGKTTHRVLDSNGVFHCIPWTEKTVIQWCLKDSGRTYAF